MCMRWGCCLLLGRAESCSVRGRIAAAVIMICGGGGAAACSCGVVAAVAPAGGIGVGAKRVRRRVSAVREGRGAGAAFNATAPAAATVAVSYTPEAVHSDGLLLAKLLLLGRGCQRGRSAAAGYVVACAHRIRHTSVSVSIADAVVVVMVVRRWGRRQRHHPYRRVIIVGNKAVERNADAGEQHFNRGGEAPLRLLLRLGWLLLLLVDAAAAHAVVEARIVARAVSV